MYILSKVSFSEDFKQIFKIILAVKEGKALAVFALP